MNPTPAKAIVVFAWNGKGKACPHVTWDAQPAFHLVLFNYTGITAVPEAAPQAIFDEILHTKTEFKGSLIQAVYEQYKDRQDIDYVGFMDDDLAISIGGINQLLDLARKENFDAFQPATSATSYDSHKFTKHQPGKEWEPTQWVEIMCPFYRKALFDAGGEFYAHSISSYGIDRYAIPYCQKILGMNKTAIVHAVTVTHLKPVTSGNQVMSNGRTALQEGEKIRKMVLAKIAQSSPGLFSSAFLREVMEKKLFRWGKWRWDIKRLLGR